MPTGLPRTILLGLLGVCAVAQGTGYELILGGQRFDPVQGPDSDTGDATDWFTALEPGADLRLVQLKGVTRDEALDQLRGSGLRIIQYIHPYTYVVWASDSQVQQARTLDAVRWSGDFATGYRLRPPYRALASSPIDVRVLRYRAAPSAVFDQTVAVLGAGNILRRNLDARFEHIGLRIRGDRLASLARVPGVYAIHPVPRDGGNRGELSNQVNVGNYDMTNLAFPGYQAWLNSVGLSGNGILIANVDSGVNESHPDLVNRFITCAGASCGGNDSSSHGTHTAGIMAADGSSGTTLTTSGGTFLRALGMAPGAQLVEQVYSPFFQQAGGMLLLMRESRSNGALLSGNSWGPSDSPLGYDDDTMQVDIGVRDADNGTPGNQEFTYVLSFMNGYGNGPSQGTPDEAKNIFTIGSTKAQQPGGEQILEIDDLSSNSAHGPALDGRTIPHMVAPGCRVDSSDTGSGFGFKCGTSMASPHVSGAVALFMEYYQDLTGGLPSPALIKAAFTAQAIDLAGNEDADGGTLGHPFDSKQGWGRMDARAVLDPQVAIGYYDQAHLFDDTDESWSQFRAIADPARPVRIMLVWTDAPGHGLGGSTAAWNNDLDLEVEVGGQTYLGNQFGGNGFSAVGGAADAMNNTEAVLFDAGQVRGLMQITVRASNINSDGVPNMGDATDQDFALVCVNCNGAKLIFSDGLEPIP